MPTKRALVSRSVRRGAWSDGHEVARSRRRAPLALVASAESVYNEFMKLLKWVVLLALIFLAWKYGLPRLQRQGQSSSTTAAAANGSCIGAARAASDAWGRGLNQFVNPPYDTNAWGSFRSDVDSRIAAAESACSDSSESCTKGRSAMRDLRGLVSDLDSAIRSGSAPPSDIVQRQEAVDRQIDEAQELVRSGK